MGFSLTFDAKKTLRGKFKPSTAAEAEFYKGLRKVAQVSGHIVESNYHIRGDDIVLNSDEMQKALRDYSNLIEPWARRQSLKLIEQVQKSNKRAYIIKSKAIGTALKLDVARDDVARVAFALMNEQVELIKSIPLEAGLRAQDIALKNILEGKRAVPDQSVIDELKTEMGLSTEVATSRAQLVARTETARANASINQARALTVGSLQYRWHNSGDGAVRESHKRYKGRPLQGQIFSWDNPPTLDDGMTGHPGTFPNCRCFAEPVFTDE
jgi:SPP1 gp7 family putative phage head morphogenesis protein